VAINLYELIIWIGIILFIGLNIIAALLYFQNEKFDKKYKKDVETIRAIKKQKLKDFMHKYFKEEEIKQIEDEKKDFPSAEDFKELQKKMAISNKNLNNIMKKSADLKMWFDYTPRAKEFLVAAALWTFHMQYSGYLSFLWIFMGIRIFRNLLRYNTVTKNISEHMDMLRDGEVGKF
jgi:hypothetical protein